MRLGAVGSILCLFVAFSGCRENVQSSAAPSCAQVLDPKFSAAHAEQITYELAVGCRQEVEHTNQRLLESLGESAAPSCGTKMDDPEIQTAIAGGELLLDNLALARLDSAAQSLISGNVYEIPVVFHVVHLGEPVGVGHNITDAQIESSLVALNNHFRKVPGTDGDGNGVDTEIQFVRAKRDINNQPHSGINRVNGSSVANYSTGGIKGPGDSVGADDATVKSLSLWSNLSYVNIWLVSEISGNNGSGGVQGYASFAGAPSSIDGIVILHSTLGTLGTVKSTANKSMTLTHEMGHVFNLYHTFHLTDSCAVESNCTTGGDKVCDTPVTPLSGSCSSPQCSGTQQVENYMDYTPQTCKDMYSNGQKVRARDSALNLRGSLLTSQGGVAVHSIDAALASYSNLHSYSCSDNIQPSVVIQNWGSSNLTSATVRFRVDGGSWNNTSYSGNLVSGASASLTLASVVAPGPGNHTVEIELINPNGLSDQYTANNQISVNLNIPSNPDPFTVAMNLDFRGVENSYTVKSGSTILYTGGGFSNNAQGTIVTTPLCMPAACYTVKFEDTYGDGQSLTNGSYTITNSANQVLFTNSGNWGFSQTHTVCVGGATDEGPPSDITPPTVSITSPVNATSYTSLQTVTINATAADASGISKVQFFDNGVLKGEDTSSPYSYAWVLTNSMNGNHQWIARAIDTAGNSTDSTIKTYVVNISGGTSAPPPSVLPPPSSASGASPSSEGIDGESGDNRSPAGSEGELQTVDGIGTCATLQSSSGKPASGFQILSWFFPFLLMGAIHRQRMMSV